MAKYFAILTETGEAKMARALVTNTMVPLTEMAVGDGGVDGGTDADCTPDIAQRALARERLRRPLNRLVADPKNPSIVIAEVYLPEEVGGWWVRELGLFDEDGDLFAVANVPPSYKPILAEGSGRGQFYRMMLIHHAAGNVVLHVDPAIVVATREYVDEQVTAVRTAMTDDGDNRYATKQSVEQLQGAVHEATELAFDALARAGGEMTGPIDMTGPSNELRFTDSQQPITIGRFRVVSSAGQLMVDRNTSEDGSFADFSRVCSVDGNGNFVAPGVLTGGGLKTLAGVNLPAHNNDGKGFLEFGGSAPLWRMLMVGETGNLVLNGHNADGTNRNQPFYVDYASGQVRFSRRPEFNGAEPWDASNLKDPLTAQGGSLAFGKGLIFGAGYGDTPLRVTAAWRQANMGGSFIEWNQSRTPALQIDAPNGLAAYMGIRWTQWGVRHLAAIDCYGGGSDTAVPLIAMHVGSKALAFTFDGNGDLTAQGAIKTGGGGVLAADGNVYMPWAKQWLSEYLSNMNSGKAGAGSQCQRAGATQSFGVVSGNPTLPNPWVVVGLAGPGNGTANAITVYGDWMRNQ
jgi:hypothetical protein